MMAGEPPELTDLGGPWRETGVEAAAGEARFTVPVLLVTGGARLTLPVRLAAAGVDELTPK